MPGPHPSHVARHGMARKIASASCWPVRLISLHIFGLTRFHVLFSWGKFLVLATVALSFVVVIIIQTWTN